MGVKIDLNCDMGESFGMYKMGLDEEVIEYISSASIACGFHAGDPGWMRHTVELAETHGVAIGAHPSYPDLVGFGRRNMSVTPEEAKADIVYQVGALQAFTKSKRLQHVKPHGAMYNQAVDDEELARAICESVREVDPEMIVIALAGSRWVEVAHEMGVRVGREIFADRALNPDGTLVSQVEAGIGAPRRGRGGRAERADGHRGGGHGHHGRGNRGRGREPVHPRGYARGRPDGGRRQARSRGRGGLDHSAGAARLAARQPLPASTPKMYDSPKFLTAGDRALVVEIGEVISPECNRRVNQLLGAIEEGGVRGVVDLVPTYRSLMVQYDPMLVSFEELRGAISEVGSKLKDGKAGAGRLVEIPTLYGGEYGPDLEFVAEQAGLSVEDVVQLHSSVDYLVYMMGFTPGFPYLGGLPERLATPRLTTPRTVIPAGSAGIAESQTGVYPLDSPGGWQLIGRTPLKLFDVERDPPSLISAGDRVRFVPLGSEEEYRRIEDEESR